MAFGLEAPVILAIVGVAATVAAAAVTTVSAVQSANRESNLGEAVAEQKTAEAMAVTESAAAEETSSRRRSQYLISKQRAITAAAGVDPLSGSPLASEVDLVQQAELEALSIRRVGELSASQRDYEAQLARYRGQTARDTIPYSIAGGVLSAASGTANVYAQYTGSRSSRSVLSDWV